MSKIKTSIDRRTFLKASSLAGGGMMISFSWLVSGQSRAAKLMDLPAETFELNGYVQLAADGAVTIMCPNPEFGQNVRTSMPMIVAEELDVDWKDVRVDMAPFNADVYDRQFSGGSQGIRRAWKALRTAGATARQMLMEVAAQQWKVPVSEISTEKGVLKHNGKSLNYHDVAAAASKLEVPSDVQLKDTADFDIISTSRKNVDGEDIVTGKPMFGIDVKKEGMLTAMIVHPPAFGMQLKSVDDAGVKSMPGIKDVFTIDTFPNDFERGFFSTNAFSKIVVITGESTWQVMQAKKALKVEWEVAPEQDFKAQGRGGARTVTVPAGLESSSDHKSLMNDMAAKPGNVRRQDGDPDTAFKNAAKVIERTYSAPFLAHNMMEPVNFFAHVTEDKIELAGPLQAPEIAEGMVASRLGVSRDEVNIVMTRMGGGFGRRAYDHYVVEAALISQKAQAPVKMVYTREDDMTCGIYRPAYHAIYRAALDENNNLIAFHVKAGGIPESPLHANRFPAGAVDNYLAEEWSISSNITIGAFRAPRSNFTGAVEQAFLDEVAELAGKDPIQFRLDLLERSKSSPVGDNNDYDPDRYAGVLKLVRDKSNWNNSSAGSKRGVAAYFCHNSYAAHVVDMKIENGKPKVEKVCSALDCGIVVNPDAAANMVEGAVVDGIGNALFGELTFEQGEAQKKNFDKYRMIRMGEAPEEIDVHFVQNDIDPTGLGEPPFPPIFAAVANALYKATGERYYEQPFNPQVPAMG